MQNPDVYEESLTQAEDACARRIFEVLDVPYGQTGNVGASRGRTEEAVFAVGELGDGSTVDFPAAGHYFRARLRLHARDRAQVQRWIMRLVETFPVGHDASADDWLREETNVCVLRISPQVGAVSAVEPDNVTPPNSVAVPVWAATVLFDVVFVARTDVDVERDEPDPEPDAPDTPTPPDPPEGGGGSTDEGGQDSGGGGSTGGDGGDLPLPGGDLPLPI